MMVVTAADQEFKLLNESMKKQTMQSVVLMDRTVAQLIEVNHGICIICQILRRLFTSIAVSFTDIRLTTVYRYTLILVTNWLPRTFANIEFLPL